MKIQKTTSQKTATRILTTACFLIIAIYMIMIDLKGITTDEGMRLGIMNGGAAYSLNEPEVTATWDQVIEANSHCAYQPFYFLMQNTLMRVTQTDNIVFLRSVNIGFLWLSLAGLLVLSKTWRLAPRLSLLGLFALNAYLFMHVLQVREYILGVTFYIWSTWLVLKLDRRPLTRPLADISLFSAYGILLVVGFYIQTWVVFPAIGQFLFLAFKRGHGKLRYYSHLALSYLIVVSATLPYILSHKQKADVGRWGPDTSDLWPQLSTGFHLILTGHTAETSSFYNFLFWLWPTLIFVAACLLFRYKYPGSTGNLHLETRRQSLLMLLCITTTLSFQIGYFFQIDNLSVWPRYFVVHYFFWTWLVGLGFNYLYEVRSFHEVPRWLRHSLTAISAVIMGVILTSSVLQTKSYYRNPLLDTGLSHDSNWRIWTRELATIVEPDDLVISHDYISRATMTFTRPMVNTVILLTDLERIADLDKYERLVYMESSYSLHERDALLARMSKLGFENLQEIKMHTADGHTPISLWKTLVFTRR